MLEREVEEPVVTVLKEISVSSDWSRFISTQHSLLSKVTPCKGEEIYLVPYLFSSEECESLIKEAESFGFGTTSYPKEYRGNLRLSTIDSELSAAVWSRLEPFVPKHVTEGGHTYEATGLNNMWRLSKYHPGDRFAAHVDTYYRAEAGQGMKSMFSVNIYMNEGFEGGKTTFSFEDEEPSREPFNVTPKTGLCLLFRQPLSKHYVHEGEEVRSGIKYLFRSDVLYKLLSEAK